MPDTPLTPADPDDSDIDWDGLARAVNAAVAARGFATLPEVLEAHPATQGVASVLGLMSLGERHGRPIPAPQTVTWTSASGRRRQGTVRPGYLFDRPIPGNDSPQP